MVCGSEYTRLGLFTSAMGACHSLAPCIHSSLLIESFHTRITNTTDVGEIATRVIREIEASYSKRKEKERLGFTSSIRHNVTYNGKNGKHGPISFADAAILIVSHNRDFEEGAIYRLADSRQKEFVEILMLSVLESSSLNSRNWLKTPSRHLKNTPRGFHVVFNQTTY